jgi:hypothetical protein
VRPFVWGCVVSIDGKMYGVDLFGEPATRNLAPLAERFGVPPFSVLDTRQGEWQERKRAWVAMGLRGEMGRSAKAYNIHEWADGNAGGSKAGGDGTSIFDPHLCEIAYRWFCPPAGQVVDPFAGGVVRGAVAALLGYRYWGCDLRGEQIAANEAQWKPLADGAEHSPVWVCGDSNETLTDAPLSDFVFSCPPYGDLEVYSDDPRDLSGMEYHTFIAEYRRIILKAVTGLKPDRFACFVVGDFRDARGFYRDFVGETVRAFEMCGARLYNEAVLVTPVGTAAMRATKQFEASRKLCKTHQNVLVFCKGDPKRAADAVARR